jgi:uncharacterized protein YigE (DUF2233 family)
MNSVVSKVFWFMATLSLLEMVRCARGELAPASESTAMSLAGAPAVGASALPTARADRHTPGPPAPPSFATVVAGLSVLSDERVDSEGHAHEWIVVRIDLEQHRLQVRSRGRSSFADLRAEANLLVAANGGFFDPQLQASGLLVSGRVVLARERSGGGSGVLAIAQRRARLLQRGARLPAKTDFAVQCGPRLIEPDGSVGIRNDDGQRAARTVACIRNGGQELDLVVVMSKGQLGDGPGLLQLARWLSEPLAPEERSGCEAALNLDGGPSTGILIAGVPELFRAPLGPVPFALLVTRPQ